MLAEPRRPEVAAPTQAEPAVVAGRRIAEGQRAPTVKAGPEDQAVLVEVVFPPERRRFNLWVRDSLGHLAAASELGRRRGLCGRVEIARDCKRGERRDDKQADADYSTAQQQFPHAEERSVDQHASQKRIEQLTRE